MAFKLEDLKIQLDKLSKKTDRIAEYYESIDRLKVKLKTDKDYIQCIVSEGFTNDEVSFGNTQRPQLWDYADNEDTIAFLLKI